MHKVEDGWHVWDTTGCPDPDAFRTTPWLDDRGRRGSWLRAMLIASVSRDAWSFGPHGRRLRVMSPPLAPNALTPEDAARLAEEPSVILVENRYSDGAFVERVAKELDKGLRSYWRKPADPIRFDSVGGVGQMADEIRRRANGKSVPPRLVTVIDSDRRYPGGEMCKTSGTVKRVCEELNLACWVLAKRESENYLPRVLLADRMDAGTDHHELLDAWDALNDDQKDFLDVKNGLANQPTPDEAALFEGLSSQDRLLLSRGFGSNVYKCWRLWHVHSTSELRARGRGDLEHGIELIRREV